MKNLLNFFFSFDKLFKEKLIVPVFWLAIIHYGLKFLVQAVDAVQLDPLNWVIEPVGFFVKIIFTLLVIRIVAELVVAIFRINDNLSPDKGRSELADIDPVAEARKAAEMAAARTREATKTVSEKASAATKSVRDNVDDMADTVQAKAKSATASVREKTAPASETTKLDPKPVAPKASTATVPKKRGRPAGSKNKPKTTAAKPAASKSTPKKRGRPAGSKNKTPAAKTTKPSTGGKRGPKPGTKVPRDADGNLLKKDGTPRKKPGPKKS